MRGARLRNDRILHDGVPERRPVGTDGNKAALQSRAWRKGTAMKRTLLASAVALTFIGAATQLSFAQPYWSEDAAGSSQSLQPPETNDPADAQDGWSNQPWHRGPPGHYSQNQANDNDNAVQGHGPGGPPLLHRPPPPPPADAARFVFQHGPARMEITCPQVFALQDCIQGATELLDKLNSLRNSPHRIGSAPSNTRAPLAAPSNEQAPAPGGGQNMQPLPGPEKTPPPAPMPGNNDRM